MIIAAGRGKLRQISLQGHQGPLAHHCLHSHTPLLMLHAHNHAKGQMREGKRERKKPRLFRIYAGPFLSLVEIRVLLYEESTPNPLGGFCCSTGATRAFPPISIH